MSNIIAQPVEDILEPALPIVDAHHHLVFGHGRRYLLDEYLHDVESGHRILGSVYVESRAFMRASGPEHMRPVGETEFANGVAAMCASGAFGPALLCDGIVSYADLRADDIDDVLDAHIGVGGGRVKGIRQPALWDEDKTYHNFAASRPPEKLLADPKFRAGFKKLGQKGLVFDAIVFHPQISELLELVRLNPDVTVIVNHLAFPLGIGRFQGKRDEVFAQWRIGMRDLAGEKNVLMKVGGLGMPMFGFDFHTRAAKPGSEELAAAWEPYVMEALETFGPERCIAESNFPPDGVSCTYTSMWNAMKRILASLSKDEKELVFGKVAIRAYDLSIEYPTGQW